MKTVCYSRLFIFLTLALICFGCRKNDDRAPRLRNVVLVKPVGTAAEHSTLYPGVIEEGASVNASFMADGKIGKINVKEGDRVAKGQLLASLDDSDYLIGVAQLEAQFGQMTAEKQRMDAMFEKRNIAPNDYEKFTAGYEQLRLQLELAKRELDYTRLYAPSSGYVATKYLNEGELVGAGTPVFNIIDDSHLLASVDLPVAMYLNRDRILSAAGYVPGIGREIPLTNVSFTPDAENNMLYHLKLAVPAAVAKELSPGMNITVNIRMTDSADHGFMVPSRAIFDEGGSAYVWVFSPSDSTIHKKPVTVDGMPLGKLNKIEGVDADDEIVEVGVKQLYEGEKVNVINRRDAGI